MPEVSPPDKPRQSYYQSPQQQQPELNDELQSSQQDRVIITTAQSTSSSSPPGIPTFTFRKPSTCNDEGEEEEEYRDDERVNESVSLMMGRSDGGDGGGPPVEPLTDNNSATVTKAFCLQVHSVDICRICQCGPNTLATPTPLLLTPITSPKKRFSPPSEEPTSSTLNTVVSIELKRSMMNSENAPTTTTPPQLQSPTTQHQHEKSGKGVATVAQLSPDYNLISPCVCSGSLKYVHQSCLQNWIRASNNTACELCKHPFQLRSKFKPIWKWESLPMVPGEKKRIVCSALFHTLALACVVWSLYVLIDRTIEELTHSDLEWQFWTKIIVEAIGCLGAGILSYVWGKSYMSLLIRWVSFNRSFVIIGKECPPPPPDQPIQIIVDTGGGGGGSRAAATTSCSHNQQESAREQELINLIN